jgi:hypothetical protein
MIGRWTRWKRLWFSLVLFAIFEDMDSMDCIDNMEWERKKDLRLKGDEDEFKTKARGQPGWGWPLVR